MGGAAIVSAGFFYLGVELRRSASAEMRLDLETVVRGRVVTGGDRDTAGQPAAAHVERHSGSRHRAVRQEDADAGGRELVGRRAGEFRREEARVVPDDGARHVSGFPARVEVADSGREAPDRRKRTTLRDNAAPAVSAEREGVRGIG